jgi:hypothetical protein
MFSLLLAFLGSIDAGLGDDWLQTGELAGTADIDRCRTGLFAGPLLLVSRNFGVRLLPYPTLLSRASGGGTGRRRDANRSSGFVLLGVGIFRKLVIGGDASRNRPRSRRDSCTPIGDCGTGVVLEFGDIRRDASA